jgi:hypothetical protein
LLVMIVANLREIIPLKNFFRERFIKGLPVVFVRQFLL